MTYYTFRVLVRFGDRARHLEVVACDIEAAKADIREAFPDSEIIQWGIA